MDSQELSSLSKRTIRDILLANSKNEQADQKRAKNTICTRLGEPLPEEDPRMELIMIRFYEWMYGVVAERLKGENTGRKSIIELEDFESFIQKITQGMCDDLGDIPEEMKEVFVSVLRSYAEATFDEADDIRVTDEDDYTFFWRVISTAVDMSKSNGGDPVEAIESELGYEELTRRLVTKEQLIDYRFKLADLMYDADKTKARILKTVTDQRPDCDPETLDELKSEIDGQLMPMIREKLDKSKAIAREWAIQEAERIYSPAPSFNLSEL